MINSATAGEQAYVEDCKRQPTYHDGTPRKSWHELPDYVRDTWERNPTPRHAEVCVLVVESDGSIRRFVDGVEIGGFDNWVECLTHTPTEKIVRVLQGMF